MWKFKTGWLDRVQRFGSGDADMITVLVLSPASDERQQWVATLEKVADVEVMQTESAQEAITLMAGSEHPIDLIVCDLDCEKMASMDFICKVGESQLNLKLVVVSSLGGGALGSAERLCEFYGIEVLDSIEKPMQPTTLAALVHRLRGQSPELVDGDEVHRAPEALEGLRGYQFEALYQPRVELSTGRVVGAEALARWHHPKQGLVEPSQFVQSLEQSGNMLELVLVMLRQAAVACARWTALGVGASVSVNVSPRALANPGFAQKAIATVRESGLSPDQVTLDLTESAGLDASSPAIASLRRLRMTGFGVSISDFGSRSTAREQLLNVPFSELGIGREVVADVLVRENARERVEATIAMAKELGIPTVATGVETQAMRDYLQIAGCDMAQGYYYAKPLTETEFVVYYKAKPSR